MFVGYPFLLLLLIVWGLVIVSGLLVNEPIHEVGNVWSYTIRMNSSKLPNTIGLGCVTKTKTSHSTLVCCDPCLCQLTARVLSTQVVVVVVAVNSCFVFVCPFCVCVSSENDNLFVGYSPQWTKYATSGFVGYQNFVDQFIISITNNVTLTNTGQFMPFPVGDYVNDSFQQSIQVCWTF